MTTENSASQDEAQIAEAPQDAPTSEQQPATAEASTTKDQDQQEAAATTASVNSTEGEGAAPEADRVPVVSAPAMSPSEEASPDSSATVSPATAGAAPIAEVNAEDVHPESITEQVAAAMEDVTEAPAGKRNVKLNPTASPEDVRPVPSIGGEVGAASPVASRPVELPAANDEEIEAEIAKAISGSSAEKTTTEFASTDDSGKPEIPQTVDVDASIEAAIEEAMSGTAVSTSSADSSAVASTTVDPDELEPGQKLTGVVQSITGDNVFLDFGMRMSGVVPFRQFSSKNVPNPGDRVDVLFDQINEEEGLIQTRLPGGTAAVQSGEWEFLSKGQMVECLVKKTNKGGLEVTVGSLRGFIPASQVDTGFVEDMETFVGKKLTAEITELKPAKKNLVLSRRKVLNARRADAKKELLEELKPDQVRTGVVKTIKDYGAFVDLGGTDGFLPISQISWVRIGHPSEVISEGQEIEVKVLSIDREKDKISLGMRQLTQNPWKVAETKYEKGSSVTGRVTKTETFGAFVELEPGIEGLVHISELEHRRVKRVTEVLNVNDMIEVQVLEVDPKKKRISLSMKALKAKPEPEEAPPEPEVEKYERKRKGPLKGGTGDPAKAGGGLFGNPNDFGGR